MVENLTVEHSLIGNASLNASLVVITESTGTGNILGQPALLGPLADNGGPTRTHALLTGSPALNAGSNAIANTAGLTADQRGFDRIEFGNVDIGALEQRNNLGLVVTQLADENDPSDLDINTFDINDLSLREAITLANASPAVSSIVINIPSPVGVPQVITVQSQLNISSSVSIEGPGSGLLTIDAQGGGDNVLDGNGFRIFEITDGNESSSTEVSISGLTLTGGDNSDSGGAISNFENLDLDDVIIVGNHAGFGGGIGNELSGVLTLSNSTVANNTASQDGGGIFTRGTLAATNVKISGNSAVNVGGAIAGSGDSLGDAIDLTLDQVSIDDNLARFGGGISNELSGLLTITNSTIADNESSQDGGGIFTRGPLTATNVTISGNSAAGEGSAIFTAAEPSGLALSLTHVTLTNNTGIDGLHFDSDNGATIATFNNSIVDSTITGVGVNGTTLAGGHNLFANADPSITGTGNLFNQTSMLGPLADNGGLTFTHALLVGSPAINAGDNALSLDESGNPLLTDQRGENRIQFDTVDIGAVETMFTEARSLVVTTMQDVDDPTDGFTSLREAIAFAEDPFAGSNNDGDADDDGSVADTITFDASVFTDDNRVIRLAQGQLEVSEGLNIDGSSVGGVVITGDANGDDITFPGTAITDVEATSQQLLVDNRRVLSFSGSGSLTLTYLTITGGSTSNVGGGIFSNSGDCIFN